MFSSRKINRATYDSVAFRYLAANTHPDHDTLARFRKHFLPELEELFVQVLAIAQAMKLLRLGHISLYGSKVKANASQHEALSHGHPDKLEAQLRKEVQALLAKAEATDREARRQAGHEPRGKEPQPPEAGPREKDPVNLTDAESRIMPVSGGGFERACNVQATVDTATMLVLATGVTQQTNDKQQVEPMPDALAALPEALGRIDSAAMDNGDFSAAHVQACLDREIEPLIALGREAHHLPLAERFGPDAPEPDAPRGVKRGRSWAQRAPVSLRR